MTLRDSRRSACSGINGGDNFGEASLTMTSRNADVVLVTSFYQDRRSREDIAQQPVTKVWQTLCEASSHSR